MLCKHCGAVCTSTYCGTECKTAYKSAHKNTLNRTCPECGVAIQRGMYCGEACNRAAESKRLNAAIMSCVAEGMTVGEIASKYKTWPRKVRELIDGHRSSDSEGHYSDIDECTPVSVASISIQKIPFTKSDEKDSERFRVCLAGHERRKTINDELDSRMHVCSSPTECT
jgi:hypothetical protein